MRLMRVELRRLWLRRVTWGALVLAVVIAGFSMVAQLGSAQPPTAQEIADAERYYAEELEYWEENGEEQVADCEDAEADDPDPDAYYACDDMAPQLEWFLPPSTSFIPGADEQMAGVEGVDMDGDGEIDEIDPEVQAIQQSMWSGWSGVAAAGTFAAAFLMLAFVVGVSFMTAEQSSGALGMWLTYEPRRARVYWSKAVAAAFGTVPVVAVGWLATVGGLYGLYAFFDNVGTVTAQNWADIAAYSGRLVLAGLLCAAVGVALGVLLRHAVAAVGVVVVGFWITSAFGFSAGTAQQWLPALNLRAWIEGGATYQVVEYSRDADGVTVEEWVTHVVSGAQGGLYLLAVGVVLTVLAALVFRRKDVA